MIEVSELAPQGLQIGGVRRGSAGETPRPEHKLAVAVDVQEDAGGILRGGGGQVVRTLVGELGGDIVLHSPGLRLRGGAGAAVGFIALVSTGATAAAPLEIVVAVEVRATIIRIGAVIIIGVLAPG